MVATEGRSRYFPLNCFSCWSLFVVLPSCWCRTLPESKEIIDLWRSFVFPRLWLDVLSDGVRLRVCTRTTQGEEVGGHHTQPVPASRALSYLVDIRPRYLVAIVSCPHWRWNRVAYCVPESPPNHPWLPWGPSLGCHAGCYSACVFLPATDWQQGMGVLMGGGG
jgi:hypothetical protein